MGPLLPDLNQAFASIDRARLDRVRRDLQPGSKADAGGNPADRPDNDLSGLRQVAKQFESIFYGQLIRSMRETVPENGFWGSGGGTKIYRQMHDQAMADGLAESGGLGIANLIVRQLEHAVPGAEVSGAGGATPTIGPPSPPTMLPPTPRISSLQAYERQGQTGERIARMVRLRHRADAVGGAAADSLDRYQRELTRATEATNLDPALLLAVMVRESGGDPAAISSSGAQGLMQLMPGTAREVGVDDPADPAQNLQGGATYLSRMLRRYDGDLDLALAAYNAGPGAVDRAGGVPNYPETQAYVAAVKRLAAELGADLNEGTDKGTDKGPDHESGTDLDKDLSQSSPRTP